MSAVMTAGGSVARAAAARAGLERLREHKTWIALITGLTLSVIVALLERRQGQLGASDRALSGVAFGAVLPILAYLASDSLLARQRLSASLSAVVRHGASPASAAFGQWVALVLVMAAAGAALGASTCIATRAYTGTPWLYDLLTSTWIGGLGGMTYATCFYFSSSFGRRGGGRKAFLALDLVLGVSSGVASLPWPRSHLRNLIGGMPPIGWSQGASALALLAILALTLGLALRRART